MLAVIVWLPSKSRWRRGLESIANIVAGEALIIILADLILTFLVSSISEWIFFSITKTAYLAFRLDLRLL